MTLPEHALVIRSAQLLGSGRCALLLWLIVSECLLSLPVHADDALVMAIFPRRNAAYTIEIFKPMAAHLSTELGREVKLVTARDLPSFWQGIEQQAFDIVHLNQYDYIRAKQQFGYEVILKNEEFGESMISGSLMCRKDSDIKTLADLRGKKILFGGGPTAMISYIVTTAMLREAGLQSGDYQTVFAKNPPNALIAVYHGLADAAGVGDIVIKFPAIKNKVNLDELKFIQVSEKMVHLPWAVKGSMSPALRNHIQHILSTLQDSEKGRQILKQAQLTNLLAVEDHHYDRHRELIERRTDE